MAQTEAGYIKDRSDHLHLEAARQQGKVARTEGSSSAANPFLMQSFLPSQSGVSEQDWFRDCDAWWRGWDAEDLRRRDLRSVGLEKRRFYDTLTVIERTQAAITLKGAVTRPAPPRRA